jgi:hypothetical protein
MVKYIYHLTHNLKVAGSNPTPATMKTLPKPPSDGMAVFCCFARANSNIAANPPTRIMWRSCILGALLRSRQHENCLRRRVTHILKPYFLRSHHSTLKPRSRHRNSRVKYRHQQICLLAANFIRVANMLSMIAGSLNLSWCL